MLYTHNGALFSHKLELISSTCSKTDGSKPGIMRWVAHILTCMEAKEQNSDH